MTVEQNLPDLEQVPCPLCGRDEPQVTPYAQDPVRVVRCGHCRLWYLSPRPTEQTTDAFYRSDDYFADGKAGYEDYTRQEKSLRRTFRRLLRHLGDLNVTGGRLLEVGSGLGYFLDEARTRFHQRDGIELSPDAAVKAAALSGATMHQSLEALPSDKLFDCIVALHVIEHVHRPAAFLQQLITHLAPDGVLLLATPDMGSFWRHAMGRRWPSFKYPEHLTFFDSVTLPRLFVELGFESPVRVPYLHDFPLADILEKLHLPAPALTAHAMIPLPATTICYAGRRHSGGRA